MFNFLCLNHSEDIGLATSILYDQGTFYRAFINDLSGARRQVIIESPYAENLAVHNGIYSNAEIGKDDITTLGTNLPLAASFKDQYTIK